MRNLLYVVVFVGLGLAAGCKKDEPSGSGSTMGGVGFINNTDLPCSLTVNGRFARFIPGYHTRIDTSFVAGHYNFGMKLDTLQSGGPGIDMTYNSEVVAGRTIICTMP